jgi:hypothetical protein
MEDSNGILCIIEFFRSLLDVLPHLRGLSSRRAYFGRRMRGIGQTNTQHEPTRDDRDDFWNRYHTRLPVRVNNIRHSTRSGEYIELGRLLVVDVTNLSRGLFIERRCNASRPKPARASRKED